jgi:hypothetical protein
VVLWRASGLRVVARLSSRVADRHWGGGRGGIAFSHLGNVLLESSGPTWTEARMNVALIETRTLGIV